MGCSPEVAHHALERLVRTGLLICHTPGRPIGEPGSQDDGGLYEPTVTWVPVHYSDLWLRLFASYDGVPELPEMWRKAQGSGMTRQQIALAMEYTYTYGVPDDSS